MNAAVSLSDVVKTFEGVRAVDGITLDIDTGEIFGLLGPNGAGKSTTIRMILDIFRPDAGSIRVLGEDPWNGVKGRIGYLPEDRGLYRKMKIIEMLEFQGSIKGARPRAARKEATAWLERLDLGPRAEAKVEELSKGNQQKVQFIAAVMGKPELLILDEPFSGMDPVNQDLFKNLLLEVNRDGTTVIFSTHQMETAEKLCNKIALINKGRLVLHGALASLKSSFGKNSVLLEYDGNGDFLDALPGVLRVDRYPRSAEVRLDVKTDPQSVLTAAVGRVRVTRFEVVAPTLHNIFIEQVGGSAEPSDGRGSDA